MRRRPRLVGAAGSRAGGGRGSGLPSLLPLAPAKSPCDGPVIADTVPPPSLARSPTEGPPFRSVQVSMALPAGGSCESSWPPCRAAERRRGAHRPAVRWAQVAGGWMGLVWESVARRPCGRLGLQALGLERRGETTTAALLQAPRAVSAARRSEAGRGQGGSCSVPASCERVSRRPPRTWSRTPSSTTKSPAHTPLHLSSL